MKKTEPKISLSIKRKTLDKILQLTSGFAAADFVIVPCISSLFGGEYKSLHEYLGLPPQMSELAIRTGAAYWGLVMLYNVFLRKRFLGKKD